MVSESSGQSDGQADPPAAWTQATEPHADHAWNEEYAYEEDVSVASLHPDDRRLAQAFGWFSIGLGLVELLAPRALGQAIGVGDHRAALRLIGARQFVSGVGLLSERGAGSWAWSRAAGDAVDLALLSAALRSPCARPGRIVLAAATVLGLTAVDLYIGRRLMQSGVAIPEIRVSEVVTVERTPQTLYAFWRNLENLPLFMSHLQSVSKTSERTFHCIARAPAGAFMEWDAEIVNDEPDGRIGWRTPPNSEVVHEGVVTFEPATGGRSTTAHVELLIWSRAAKIGARLARLFGKAPHRQISDDLQRLKRLLETRDVAAPSAVTARE
jgi:uncharacterized membrane protein